MNTLLAADLIGLDKIINSDPVAITFFIGYMAMFASAVFFFVERSSVSDKWKTSLLVSGLITGIAAVHYYYMRDFYLQTGQSPTAFRYVDWTLTVPLMCVEFYLLTKPFGAKTSTLTKLILASLLMLITGYIGETSGIENNVMWGIISTVGYLYIVYEVFAGDVAKLAKESDSPALGRAMFLLKIFITLGWSIYPLGYMVLPGNLLSGAFEVSSIDLFYNLADAINKIGFGLVIYSVAISETNKNKKVQHA
ncbi:bacteriorhodopsin-like [Aquiflexum gelatinilyticum]|uniref:Bacteriorhodopsin-like n=1 Tax=Aquiflexum gelatinilyticum TaxID=2961943 RepID=A0A9X2PD47_9BACT|nr:bacteriorhodopsin-like [Aquiflexum gelatinilyticum]MCR9017384.1 bacteriorhodopsin-like [Aquiflexum gelatinilyticum]